MMTDLSEAHGTRHALVRSAQEADLVLLCGSFAQEPTKLTEHPLYVTFTEKCAVYSADDSYCPIAPGVYTSPRRGLSTMVGRVRSHGYASSFGTHVNEAVVRASGTGDGSPGSRRLEDERLLFSFEGSPASRVRRRLLAMSNGSDDALVRDTSSSYQHFDHAAPGRDAGQQRFVETVMRSDFVVCPRGVGTGTLRLFETMSLGVAPVLVSDPYVLPRGPRWETFLVRVPERKVHQLSSILRPLAASSAERGARARQEWLRWFAPHVIVDGIIDAAAEALRVHRSIEGVYRRSAPLVVADFNLRRRIRRTSAAVKGRVANP
jgi:Exostosin family